MSRLDKVSGILLLSRMVLLFPKKFVTSLLAAVKADEQESLNHVMCRDAGLLPNVHLGLVCSHVLSPA